MSRLCDGTYTDPAYQLLNCKGVVCTCWIEFMMAFIFFNIVLDGGIILVQKGSLPWYSDKNPSAPRGTPAHHLLHMSLFCSMLIFLCLLLFIQWYSEYFVISALSSLELLLMVSSIAMAISVGRFSRHASSSLGGCTFDIEYSPINAGLKLQQMPRLMECILFCPPKCKYVFQFSQFKVVVWGRWIIPGYLEALNLFDTVKDDRNMMTKVQIEWSAAESYIQLSILFQHLLEEVSRVADNILITSSH